jgi:hypothetical protein
MNVAITRYPTLVHARSTPADEPVRRGAEIIFT